MRHIPPSPRALRLKQRSPLCDRRSAECAPAFPPYFPAAPGGGSKAFTRAGEACPAIIIEPHDVAVADVARGGVVRMDADRLATADFRGLARGAEIELAVQPGRRLVGNELQRKPCRAGRPRTI